MVQIERCNCAAMGDEKIDTWDKFKKAKEYFETQIKRAFSKKKK